MNQVNWSILLGSFMFDIYKKYKIESFWLYCFYLILFFELIPSMLVEYKLLYHSKRISERKLQQKILNIFTEYDCDHPYNYDQLLFIFDLKCTGNNPRCNREICHELYRQSCDLEGKTTITNIVQVYIENIQTAKVSLLRDEYKLKELQQKAGGILKRDNTFVYLKVIQASVYSRFSDTNLFSYRISPSNIPPITLQNTINHVFNHQFTLQLEQPYFTIDFYQSGIQIYSWTFPDEDTLQQGEYERSIKCQNIDFEVKLKYLPKNTTSLKKKLSNQITEQQKHLLMSKGVFFKLCEFDPFVSHKGETSNNNQQLTFIEKIIDFLPFLKNHVQNVYYLLILFILLECLASYYVSIEFVDIILAFYTIGLLFDQSIIQYGMKIILLIFSFALCIIKTFWGVNSPPFYVKHNFQVPVLILCVVMKVIIIIFLTICLGWAQQIPQQRHDLYSKEEKQTFVPETIKQEDTESTSIWQTSISQS